MTCGGRGCPSCNDTGVWLFSECPGKFVTPDTAKAMELVTYAKDGAWPKAGGTLDQTQWFLDAYRFIRSERNHWRMKRGLTDG